MDYKVFIFCKVLKNIQNTEKYFEKLCLEYHRNTSIKNLNTNIQNKCNRILYKTGYNSLASIVIFKTKSTA